MTVGKGYAPLGKSKVIATPDVNKNNKSVATSKDKKDTNPVKGKGAARPQTPVTWYQYVVWISKNGPENREPYLSKLTTNKDGYV